jgi:hypothetical protein
MNGGNHLDDPMGVPYGEAVAAFRAALVDRRWQIEVGVDVVDRCEASA